MAASFSKAVVTNAVAAAKARVAAAWGLFRDREIYIQDGEDFLKLSLSRKLQFRCLSAVGVLGGVTLVASSLLVLRVHHVADGMLTELHGQLANLQSAYDKNQATLHRLTVSPGDDEKVAENAQLEAQVAQLQAQLHNVTQQNTQLHASLDKKQHDAAAKVAEAPKAAAEPEAKDSDVKKAEAKQAEPKKVMVEQAMAKPGKASTLRIGALLRQLGMKPRADEGGPFVALAPNKPVKLSPAVTKMLRSMPLSIPLGTIKISSPFGGRIDPINGERSFHPGIDLMGAYRTPVYATGPGVVVHAGWYGGYGNMVEIDHGHGVHTRYGHLYKVKVNVGQHITGHKVIGLLGSTGRSTGPHVHYEVDVNGEPVDPMKFVDAGKSIIFVKASEPAGRD